MNENTYSDDQPLIPASTQLPELTFKVIILSIILAVVLAASNAYLALKIGTTISASIPASVLALGILRFFRHSNILESNIVQTAASAGEGVAAALAFVLPAMVILRVWNHFPYWEIVLITSLGGIMGVFFSVPLRRVMLNMPSLPFPEGTAIGKVLGASQKGGQQLKLLAYGGGMGALVSLFQTGFKIISDNLQLWALSGKAMFGLALGFAPAPLAAGYIVGVRVAISLLVGLILGWLVALPILSLVYGVPAADTLYQSVTIVWANHLRFIGVGTMLVGGIWTLVRLAKPVIEGIQLSITTLKQSAMGEITIPRTERDIPFTWVLIGVAVFALLLYGLFIYIAAVDVHFYLSPVYLLFVAFVTLLFVLIVGFLLATVCAYFTGLVGSSNNPVSGLLIIAVLILGFIYLLLFNLHSVMDQVKATALLIIVTAVIATIISISNENLQDLKAGRMVGATPWKQQFTLVIGVVASAFIIGPVLQLLFQAYGIAGVFPRAGMDPTQMLAAPQASLMAAIAKGVLTHHLDWSMIITGVVLGTMIILVDEYLKTKNYRLPALAVGLGIYLPAEVTAPFIIGGFISYFAKRKNKKNSSNHTSEFGDESRQSGVLLASGLVAGNAIMGVVLAIPFVILGSGDALALMPVGLKWVADMLGVITLIALCYWMYHVSVQSKKLG